jgi:hypothetical protein
MSMTPSILRILAIVFQHRESRGVCAVRVTHPWALSCGCSRCVPRWNPSKRACRPVPSDPSRSAGDLLLLPSSVDGRLTISGNLKSFGEREGPVLNCRNSTRHHLSVLKWILSHSWNLEQFYLQFSTIFFSTVIYRIEFAQLCIINDFHQWSVLPHRSILSCPSSIDSTKSKRKKSSPKMDLSDLLSGLKDPLTWDLTWASRWKMGSFASDPGRGYHAPKCILFFKSLSWLGQIKYHCRDETWSASLWQTK